MAKIRKGVPDASRHRLHYQDGGPDAIGLNQNIL